MKKELVSNYANVDENEKIIFLYDSAPSANGRTITLENVKIEVEDTILRIEGECLVWGFRFEPVWLSDLSEKPEERYIKFRYKNLKDFFHGIKKPYIGMGWFLYEKRKPYKAEMSQWFLVL